jgi:hypothetical protein
MGDPQISEVLRRHKDGFVWAGVGPNGEIKATKTK